MTVPLTKWYLKCAKLRPEARSLGYETELVEYATYHWFKFYWFTIYLNDWRDDC